MSRILHLTTASAWSDASRAGVYRAESLVTEGFIHCSDPRQLIRVADTRFAGRRDLVLLQVSVAKLTSPVRYENLEGGTDLFPHVYGAIPLEAIVRSDPFPCRDDGTFEPEQLRTVLDGAAADDETLRALSHGIAAAIARRDIGVLASLLAPDFTQRGADGTVAGPAAFLDAIGQIPGEIVLVQVDRLTVDAHGDAAMVTGVQHARVVIDGATVDDRRAFADFFVRIHGAWKLRAAADFVIADGGPPAA